MEQFLNQYGYAALMLGTFLEGETAILVASALIYRGGLSFPLTVAAAFAGAFVGDWVYYSVGRLNGHYFVARRPALYAMVTPVTDFFRHHRMQILFSYRFLYGFRVLIPIVIGMSGLKPLPFLFYSTVTGLLWAGSVSTTGYWIGRLLELRLQAFEENILVVILGFGTFGSLVGYGIKRVVDRTMKADSVAQFARTDSGR